MAKRSTTRRARALDDGLAAALHEPLAAAAARVPPRIQGTEFDLTEFGPQHRFLDRTARGLGWLRDLPDFRDGTLHAPAVKFEQSQHKTDKRLHSKATKPILAAASDDSSLPPKVDNRVYCSPIEDQGNLGSCTAQAGAGLVE